MTHLLLAHDLVWFCLHGLEPVSVHIQRLYSSQAHTHTHTHSLKQKLKQTSDIGRYCLDLMIEKQKKPATESDLLEGFVYEEEDEDEETPEDATDGKAADRTGVGADSERKDGATDITETK